MDRQNQDMSRVCDEMGAMERNRDSSKKGTSVSHTRLTNMSEMLDEINNNNQSAYKCLKKINERN